MGDLTYGEAIDAVSAAIEESLPAVCREILAWHATGRLPDGKFREAANILEPTAGHGFVQIAEGIANKAAMRRVVELDGKGAGRG